ncbi:MAG TPA: glycosyltransferase family 2 protein [Thermoanaerobaculia bacterium]|nr:glycosyltransferase family 2 protein [Thermoanaerobaculia bacterium]
MDISVIVTCHEPYRKWLPGVLASIDVQSARISEKVIAFDNCTPPPLPDSWLTIHGTWGNPADARNAGMSMTRAPWLIFWDADNIMPQDYVAAMHRVIANAERDVGIIYPDLMYCKTDLTPIRFSQQASWNYWKMRVDNCVDTASAWRRSAVATVGGWQNRCNIEDFALALDVTGAGWRAKRLEGPPVMMREHEQSRVATLQREGTLGGAFWSSCSLAVVTLFGGRLGALDRWSKFLLTADLPHNTSLYVVDDTGRQHFRPRLFSHLAELLRRRSFAHVDIVPFTIPGRLPATDVPFEEERHLRIATLYARVLPRVTEDLVLTFEDDIVSTPTAAKALAEELFRSPNGSCGAVAAAYTLRGHPQLVCAGLGNGSSWGNAPAWRSVPHEAIEIPYVGGAFTLWASYAVRRAPVMFDADRELGWDAMLCEFIRQRGFSVRLHGGVRLRHLTRLQEEGWITEDYR